MVTPLNANGTPIVEGVVPEPAASALGSSAIPVPPAPHEVRHPRTLFKVQLSHDEIQSFLDTALVPESASREVRALYGDLNFLGLLNSYGEVGRELGDRLLGKLGELAREYFPGALFESPGGDEFYILFAAESKVVCDSQAALFFEQFDKFRRELFSQERYRDIAVQANEQAWLRRGMSQMLNTYALGCRVTQMPFTFAGYAEESLGLKPRNETEAELMLRAGERALELARSSFQAQQREPERRNIVGNFFLAQVDLPEECDVSHYLLSKIQGDIDCSAAKRGERPYVLPAQTLRSEIEERRKKPFETGREQGQAELFAALSQELLRDDGEHAHEIKREMWKIAAQDPRLTKGVYRLEQLYDLPVAFFLGVDLKATEQASVAVELFDQARFGPTNKHLGHEFGDLLIVSNLLALQREFLDEPLFRMGGSSLMRLSLGERLSATKVIQISDQLEQVPVEGSKYFERFEMAKADAAQRQALHSARAAHTAYDLHPNIGTVTTEQVTLKIDATTTFGEIWRMLNSGKLGRGEAA